jgi:hypothetical protein
MYVHPRVIQISCTQIDLLVRGPSVSHAFNNASLGDTRSTRIPRGICYSYWQTLRSFFNLKLKRYLRGVRIFLIGSKILAIESLLSPVATLKRTGNARQQPQSCVQAVQRLSEKTIPNRYNNRLRVNHVLPLRTNRMQTRLKRNTRWYLCTSMNSRRGSASPFYVHRFFSQCGSFQHTMISMTARQIPRFGRAAIRSEIVNAGTITVFYMCAKNCWDARARFEKRYRSE